MGERLEGTGNWDFQNSSLLEEGKSRLGLAAVAVVAAAAAAVQGAWRPEEDISQG